MLQSHLQPQVVAELARVSAAAEAVARETTRDAALRATTRELTALLETTGCVVSELEGKVLREVAAWWRDGKRPDPEFAEYAYLLDDYPLTRAVMDTRAAMAISLADDAVERAEAFVLREMGMDAVLMLPFVVGGRPWGLVEVYDERPRRFAEGEAALADVLLRQVAGVLVQLEQTAAVQRLYRETLASLANALEAKDSYTSDHAQEVVDLAVDVAGVFALDEEAVRAVELGALLHDIGKIRIPESILNKPGPLDEREWDVIRSHTEAGEAILQPIELLRDVLPIVRSSHERWDGRGYPDGLAGDEIPLGARIVSVCDAFRAMVEPRPYRPARAEEQARQELSANAGTQFDPACVRALLAVLNRRESSYELLLHRPAA
ncbi:MAG TPA: HD domain-containing phosphohydrolase [Gaiellaceae bacterium]|jgi:putative nucleotidyltransferase with HDIG domain|nr:HD domain-containing phosphohydrolase [Gaiellaceae bacterium]